VNSPIRTSAIRLLQYLQLLYLPSELDIDEQIQQVTLYFYCMQYQYHPVIPTVSPELDGDRSITQVGCHGEVGNGGNEGGGRSDVVEDALFTRDHEARSNESDRRGGHDTSDSPVPVRAMGGDVDVGRLVVVEHVTVHPQRVVDSLFDDHLDVCSEECK
jgi:hypothetical protein